MQDYQSLLGKETLCACGRTHGVLTERIDVSEGAPENMALFLKEKGVKKACLLADKNTWRVSGETARTALVRHGIDSEVFIWRSDDLHADEYSLGAALIRLPEDANCLVAVGSGSVNDTTRVLAQKTGKPFVVLGTAPSMDGYASVIAPLIEGGAKVNLISIAPMGVFAQPSVLSAAPQKMLAAGVGDVLGKLPAALDWHLGAEINGEARCPVLVGQVAEAVDEVFKSADGLAERRPDAISGLMEALTLSGLAMQMMGNSRPASGAEHMISHFLETLDLLRGKTPTLHGDKVGVGTILIMKLYGKYFERLPEQEEFPRGEWERGLISAYGHLGMSVLEQERALLIPDAERARRRERLFERWSVLKPMADALSAQAEAVARAIRVSGGPVTARELGYSDDEVHQAILYCFAGRERYTLLRMAYQIGGLHRLATEAVNG